MVNKEFFAALADLEKEKGISRTVFIEALQNALASACKKQFAGESGSVRAVLDPDKCTIMFYLENKIVDDGEEFNDGEICLEEALRMNPDAKVGEILSVEVVPKDFGRIAAQTAKQVILQKLHETERDNTLSEFSDKEGELMSGFIRKNDMKNVYVELLGGQIEGLMLPQDQVPGENYEIGKDIKVFVKKVRGGKNAQVLVSRSAPGLVKRLFEEEVPEIRQGTVVIKSVSREPGHRTKMAIWSEDPRIDAVGACVGNKGARVNAVVAELGGEKVDIIPWSQNTLEFIAKSLSPASVLSVTQVGEKSAIAVVADDKLSLAIGRDGQNARLAARLTGWKIDVKSETAASKLNLEEMAYSAPDKTED